MEGPGDWDFDTSTVRRGSPDERRSRRDTLVEDGVSRRATLTADDEENGIAEGVVSVDQTVLGEEECTTKVKRRSVMGVSDGGASSECWESTRLSQVILPILQQVCASGCTCTVWRHYYWSSPDYKWRVVIGGSDAGLQEC